MSDGGEPSRDWRLFVNDMIECAVKIQSYTARMDQSAFVTSPITYDATLRNLELIGEAATHVPESVRGAHPEVPWRSVIATRNRIIHGYLGIDDDLIWSVVQDDIPALLTALRQMVGSTPQ